MTSVYSTVQNAVYSVDYGHLNSLDLARESKTFMDLVVRALEFNSVALLLTVKPASPILTIETDFVPAFPVETRNAQS